MKQDEKILTYKLVKELGLDKLEVITPDMLECYTSIGEYAFADYSALTSITIPNSVTSIGNYAFECCPSLTSIIIPNSVTSIGNYSFCDCYSITSITIPNSVTRIGDEAFNRCNNLKNVVIENKTYETQTVVNGKCKAYKAFNCDLTCRLFQI